jgi:hypothetical protein
VPLPSESTDRLSIYDVLRRLVDKAPWPEQAELLRVRAAIDQAEQSKLFGTEGMMQL